jgi:hypothetical protein
MMSYFQDLIYVLCFTAGLLAALAMTVSNKKKNSLRLKYLYKLFTESSHMQMGN